MQLGEVVLQGAPGFSELTRVPIGPGVTIVTSDGSAQSRGGVLPDAVAACCFPRSRVPERSIGAEARVGIVARNGAGEVYRILRDMKSGQCSMLAVDGGAAVASEADEVERQVAEQLGPKTADTLLELFILRKEDLPSSGSSEQIPVAAAIAPENEAKAAAIRAQMEDAQKRDASQFEIDGWQRELFEIEDKLRPLEDVNRRLEDIEREIAGQSALESIPEDLLQQADKIRAHREAVTREAERTKTELDRIQREVGTQLSRTGSPVQMLRASFEDPLVKFGTIFGVLAIAGAIGGSFVVERLRLLALLDIPAFGIALVGAVRFLGDAELTSAVRRERRQLRKKSEEAERALEDSKSQMKALLAPHNRREDDLEDLERDFRRLADMKERRAQIRKERDQLGDIAALVERRDALSSKISAAEDQLYLNAAGMPDVGQLQAQLEALERPSAPPSGPSPLKALKAASLQLRIDENALFDEVKARAGQMLLGLSDQRYTALELRGGLLFVQEAVSQSGIAFVELPPGDQDTVLIALRLALVERTTQQMQMPFFLSRAFAGFPEAKTPLLVRVLQFLGTKTQVVCVTDREGLLSAGASRVLL